MTTQTSELTEPLRARMSALHMLILVIGVLAAAGSNRLLADIDYLWWGLAVLAAGVTLLLVGAAGLGRSIHSTPIAVAGYPTRLEGRLDPALSRGMWLVKWLLAFPHYIVLAVLWTAFPVVVLASGIVILFTGRYPASLFDFAVGVLRWNWRVVFYATGVLATDHYPPFTLARTGFPATFEVAYPDRLSRGKVLVKAWLLALPHLIIVGVLAGLAWVFSDGPGVGGLVGLLVFVAAVGLLFTGTYSQGLFDLIMGIHRWIYRVYAYTSLLRDDYPPFRLDQGALEPSLDLAPGGTR